MISDIKAIKRRKNENVDALPRIIANQNEINLNDINKMYSLKLTESPFLKNK